MFQWNITLSDKQVIMLAAFNVAEDDSNGCRFHSCNAMIGDAWDVRAVRKLQEMGLISVETFQKLGITPNNGVWPSANRWNITEKGQCIARAIQCDAHTLQQMRLRKGAEQRRLVNNDGFKRYKAKQAEKYKAKKGAKK